MLHGSGVSYSSEQSICSRSLAQLPPSTRLHFSRQCQCFLGKRPTLTCTSSSSSTPLTPPFLPTHTETAEFIPTLPPSFSRTPIPTTTPTPTPACTTATTSTPNPASPPASAASPRKAFQASRTPKLYPWLIVGIGNPGSKFQKTRHNIGFEMIDAIAQAEGIKLNTIQQRALTGKGLIGSTQVLLAKPQTYVNLTGESVGPLAAYYRIPVQQILVIYDDTELEFGLMRLQTKGGPTTNNGVKSVIDHLKGCRSFPRLRIGIGSVPGTMDPGAFVLQRFHEPEMEEIDELIARVPVLIREMVTAGIEKTASSWNEIRKSRMLLTSEEKEILQRISSTTS